MTIWDPSSHATYLLQNSVLTWQGWNNWGGYDMYGGAPPGQTPQYDQRAYVESFDRPYENGKGAADFMALEYPLVYWAEQHGLDVTYWTDVTFSQHPGFLKDHKALFTWATTRRGRPASGPGWWRPGPKVSTWSILVPRRCCATPACSPAPWADREEVDYRDPTSTPFTGPTRRRPRATLGRRRLRIHPLRRGGGHLPGLRPEQCHGGDRCRRLALRRGRGDRWYPVAGLEAGDYDAYDTSEENPPDVEVLSHSPVTPPWATSCTAT